MRIYVGIWKPAAWWISVGCLLWVVSLLFGSPDAFAQYLIGPGDVLRVTVLGNRELDMDIVVQPDGNISVPLVGDIQAGGKTANALSRTLQTELAPIVRNPLVSVAVKEINSLQIRILGQVKSPGVYKVQGKISILQALAMAGGQSELADLSEAYLLRRGDKIGTNLERLLKQADLSQDVAVLPGDTVVIPATKGLGNSIYVFGEVRRPGIQLLTKEMTALQALINAGGFTNFASLRNVSIIRGPDDKKEKIRVNVRELLDNPERGRDIPLTSGDVIYVPEGIF